VSPFPNFRRWEQIPQQRLEASDAAVLDTANWVLGKQGLRPMHALQNLFEADQEFLCTFQELDHYGARDDAQYRGSVFTSDEGAEAIWPAQGEKCVYVYLRPGMPAFDVVAQQLSDLQHSVLWVAPDVTHEIRRRFEGPRFKFTNEPLRIVDAAAAADAAVLYAGHGTVSAMLLAGVPLALFPVHVEQALVTQSVVRMGAGLPVPPKADAAQVEMMLSRVVDEPHFRERAEAFASKYAHCSPRDTATQIAGDIERRLAP
jgi:UDP:flavonoid glycosyltransferase YjiC (YdhE family)